MATIKYNGMEIESISECKVFNEPRNMLVWNSCYNGPVERLVCAIIPYRHAGSVITTTGAYEYCAEIPEKPAPRRATYREFAKWLAQGNGEMCSEDDGANLAYNNYDYDIDYEDEFVKDIIKVRKWDDTEWHEPTVEYMGIADVTTFEDVVKREG